jgi:Outer membrane protein beta-barrel domain
MKNSSIPNIFSKYFYLIFLFVFIVNISFAQDAKESWFRIGAKGGVNINKLNGISYKDGFNYNFQAGVFAQIKITKKLSIQPEVNFVQTQTEFSDDANTVTDDLFLGGTQHKAKLDYLEVPLLLSINIGPTKKVKLQFGPAYGGLLKQTVDSLKTNVSNIYKNGEWSAIGGLWIQLPLVNLSARYKYGFTNINGINNQTWRNEAIQISVGITL